MKMLEAKGIRIRAIDDCIWAVKQRTQIPKDAKNPTRDAIVILGEEIIERLQQLKNLGESE